MRTSLCRIVASACCVRIAADAYGDADALQPPDAASRGREVADAGAAARQAGDAGAAVVPSSSRLSEHRRQHVRINLVQNRASETVTSDQVLIQPLQRCVTRLPAILPCVHSHVQLCPVCRPTGVIIAWRRAVPLPRRPSAPRALSFQDVSESSGDGRWQPHPIMPLSPASVAS